MQLCECVSVCVHAFMCACVCKNAEGGGVLNNFRPCVNQNLSILDLKVTDCGRQLVYPVDSGN